MRGVRVRRAIRPLLLVFAWLAITIVAAGDLAQAQRRPEQQAPPGQPQPPGAPLPDRTQDPDRPPRPVPPRPPRPPAPQADWPWIAIALAAAGVIAAVLLVRRFVRKRREPPLPQLAMRANPLRDPGAQTTAPRRGVALPGLTIRGVPGAPAPTISIEGRKVV